MLRTCVQIFDVTDTVGTKHGPTDVHPALFSMQKALRLTTISCVGPRLMQKQSKLVHISWPLQARFADTDDTMNATW